jgi:hypothetical protein
MKKTICLLLGAFLLAQSACNKDRATMVEGHITDRVTGEPIAGANINYILYLKNSPSNKWESTETDASGYYMITVPPKLYIDFLRRNKGRILAKFIPRQGNRASL